MATAQAELLDIRNRLRHPMSTQKFACPNCSQHIEAGQEYAGLQINCPNCQCALVVPASPLVVKLPSVSAAPSPPTPPVAVRRLTVRPVHAAAAMPQSAPPPPLTRRPSVALHDLGAEPSASKGKRILIGAAVVLALGAGLFGAISLGGRVQKKFNESRAKDDDPGVIGGQVGHIAELYNVLDATDPNKMGRMSRANDGSDRGAGARARRARTASSGSGNDSAPAPESLPVLPATWTLDADAARIPNGRVSGLLSGSNFVASSVFLLSGTATPVLALRQGEGADVDRELLIYLRLKRGEKIEGGAWTFSKEQTGAVPQVLKRWKPAPRMALQQKSFANGYAMKLEFGKLTDDGLPGKIYVALPDAEQTVVAGVFNAEIRVASAAQGAAKTGAGSLMTGNE
jgi:hypothetical protein